MQKRRPDPPDQGWTTRLEVIADHLDIQAVDLGRMLDAEGLRMGTDASERAITEGYAQRRYDDIGVVVDWHVGKVSAMIRASGDYRAFRLSQVAPAIKGPQIQPAKPEDQDWKNDADTALKNGDAVSSVECAIESRFGEEEQKALSAITKDLIREVMDEMDSERKEEGLPTFAEVVGAYEHIDTLKRVEHQLASRDEEACWRIGREIKWTKSYYGVKFPLYRWHWGKGEYGPDDEISWLLDCILDWFDLTEEEGLSPSGDTKNEL